MPSKRSKFPETVNYDDSCSLKCSSITFISRVSKNNLFCRQSLRFNYIFIILAAGCVTIICVSKTKGM